MNHRGGTVKIFTYWSIYLQLQYLKTEQKLVYNMLVLVLSYQKYRRHLSIINLS